MKTPGAKYLCNSTTYTFLLLKNLLFSNELLCNINYSNYTYRIKQEDYYLNDCGNHVI